MLLLSVLASSVTLLSVGPDGTPFRQGSNGCKISADGRWVAMSGHPATWPPGMSVRDLVADTLAPIPFPPGVTSGWITAISNDGDAILYESGSTAYVYEQATGLTTDVIHGGGLSNLSPDGRYVLYTAAVPGDPLMMHDRMSGVDAQLAQHSNSRAAMSQDNRYVVFGQSLLDRSTGTLTRFKDCAGPPTISADGRYIAYPVWIPDDIPEPNYCRIIDRATGSANGFWYQDAHSLQFTHDGRYLLLDNYMYPSLYDRESPGRGGATPLGPVVDLPSISDDGQKIAYSGLVNLTYHSYLLTR